MAIGRTAPRHQAIALLYPQSKPLRDGLFAYYTAATQLCHHIWTFTQKNRIKQFGSALGSTALDRFQADLDKWGQEVKDEVNLLLAQQVDESSRGISKIGSLLTKGTELQKHQQRQRERHRILDLCSTYDYVTT